MHSLCALHAIRDQVEAMSCTPGKLRWAITSATLSEGSYLLRVQLEGRTLLQRLHHAVR